MLVPPLGLADYTKGVEGFSYTYYEDLTPEDTLSIIDTIKKGGMPKVSHLLYRGGQQLAGWSRYWSSYQSVTVVDYSQSARQR